MASILGFELKGVKTWQGREWEGCQGHIYYRGEKVGWYNNDGNGGMADIDFYVAGTRRKEIEALLDAAIKVYYKHFPLVGQFAELEPDGELFMEELITLIENEKLFKKSCKAGRPFMAVYREKKTNFCKAMSATKLELLEPLKTDESIQELKIYKDLSDFNIVLGELQ